MSCTKSKHYNVGGCVPGKAKLVEEAWPVEEHPVEEALMEEAVVD
jgi:hypothetical protein